MNRRLLSLALITALTLVVLVPTGSGITAQSLGSGKMNYVVATISEPQTVDPAKVTDEFDFAGAELIRNVYDPLIFFKGSNLYSFVPWLATSWTISPDGTRYNFVIRQNVSWQDVSYGIVTPADVEYSLEKILVRDYVGGPAYMLYSPIFGVASGDDLIALLGAAGAGQAIGSAITSDVTSVTIQFATGVAYPDFLVILARAHAGIQSRQWAIDNGDWNPSVDRLSDGTWVNAHKPPLSPLDSPRSIMMGSGPYKFGNWTKGFSWIVFRFDNFWGGWGANRASSLLGTSTMTRGYLDQIVEYLVSNWAARKVGFIGSSPSYDNIYVEAEHRAEVWQQPGVKCRYPLELRAWTERYWARDWVHGWYHNPIFFPGCYFYSMWKEDIYASTGTFAGKHANWEDVNEDGKVDIKDLAAGALAFGGYYIDPDLPPPDPPGPPGFHPPNWDSRCDLNVIDILTGARGDMKTDIKDLATMAKLFGFIADPWTPGP